jgi:hypothetical protein
MPHPRSPKNSSNDRNAKPESYPRTQTRVKRAAAFCRAAQRHRSHRRRHHRPNDVAGPVAATLEVFGGARRTTELFDRVVAVNVRGSFCLATLGFAREMARRGGGCLVQIASILRLHFGSLAEPVGLHHVESDGSPDGPESGPLAGGDVSKGLLRRRNTGVVTRGS